MLMYDAVAPLGPELIIVLTLTFAIVLAAILIVGIRRRRKTGRLRAELHRMSARITALELAENMRLMIRVKSAPFVAVHVPDLSETADAA
jgi:hypothetical protein